MWLFSLLQSGLASFVTNGSETLHLKVEKKRIDVNLMDKELLKDLLKSLDKKTKSPLKKLTRLKRIAQNLKREGLTLTISYRNSLLVTLGSEAKPSFPYIHAITGTDAIQIHNLKQFSQIVL